MKLNLPTGNLSDWKKVQSDNALRKHNPRYGIISDQPRKSIRGGFANGFKMPCRQVSNAWDTKLQYDQRRNSWAFD